MPVQRGILFTLKAESDGSIDKVLSEAERRVDALQHKMQMRMSVAEQVRTATTGSVYPIDGAGAHEPHVGHRQ